MPKFRNKPVVIDAFKWTVDTVPDWWEHAEGVTVNVATGSAFIPTLEGTQEARVGDYIIQGIKGQIDICESDEFALIYEPVEQATSA